MQTLFFSRTTRGVLLALLTFGCVGHVLAQTTGARGGTTQARRPATNTNANRGTTAQGGGGGGGSTSGGNRQYINSTMIGDAMITSDLETRRLIVVTDEETNESIRTIVASLDKPKPQVLINVVFVQVTHDKDLDLGTEATWTGKLAVKTEPNAVASSRFGLADALVDPTKFGAFYRILGEDVRLELHLHPARVLTRADAVATLRGELDPDVAFMRGQVKMRGDMATLLRLMPPRPPGPPLRRPPWHCTPPRSPPRGGKGVGGEGRGVGA